MAVPVQTGRIDPEPLLQPLSALHAHVLVQGTAEEVVQVTIVWIILAVLLFLWILKTM